MLQPAVIVATLQQDRDASIAMSKQLCTCTVVQTLQCSSWTVCCCSAWNWLIADVVASIAQRAVSGSCNDVKVLLVPHLWGCSQATRGFVQVSYIVRSILIDLNGWLYDIFLDGCLDEG